MKELILQYVYEYRFVILVVLAFILYCLLEWKSARSLIGSMVDDAKVLAENAVLNSGQEQEDWVFNTAKEYLPYWKILIPDKVLRYIIHKGFYELKDYLDDGKFNNSPTNIQEQNSDESKSE